MTSDQKTKLADLRQSIMSGTYSDGTPFDFTICTTPFLYSSEITEQDIAPYIADTDYLFSKLVGEIMKEVPRNLDPLPQFKYYM